MEIAVYGKGGIGKSTISANLSAAFAAAGKRVLQIGCDPKHDSTRLLMHGIEITTVLDYIRVTGAADYRGEDILFCGFSGVGCVEAGGPAPGVGCAGRGIITAFELLERFEIKSRYDIILYDVLGDVVCGGFAVPIRQEYADTILLVTSGEYMSLYAANNILRGVKNYDGDNKRRVAGIVYNRRNIESEDARVEAFAKAVGLPILARFPRSDGFTRAEKENKTIIETGAYPVLFEIFTNLANDLIGEVPLHAAKPLADDMLESVVFGCVRIPKTVASPVRTARNCEAYLNAAGSKASIDLTDPNCFLSKSIACNEPLHGCAFNGAVSTSIHLQDAVTLAHAPKNCAYISYQSISSAGRRGLFERGALLPVAIAPNLASTDMDEAAVIFGGMDKLEEKVREVMIQKPKAIVIVSACPAGIIGDDIDRVKALFETDIPIVTVKADGNLAGDYLQGMLMGYTSLARSMINRRVPLMPDTVNVVFEKTVAKNTNGNFKLIEDYLGFMGVRVNCRFLSETTVEKLENFLSAPLNLLAYRDYTGEILEKFFVSEFGCRFFEHAFPVGFVETRDWITDIAAFFGRPEKADTLIRKNEELYLREVESLRPLLGGKKLMIITFNHELDWILQAALDVGIEIVKIGVLNYSQDAGFRTRLNLPVIIEENYPRDGREADVAKYRPDIILTNYASSATDDASVADTIPMCPDVGFFSGLNLVKRWAELQRLDLRGGWKRDERLLAKHYAG